MRLICANPACRKVVVDLEIATDGKHCVWCAGEATSARVSIPAPDATGQAVWVRRPAARAPMIKVDWGNTRPQGREE